MKTLIAYGTKYGSTEKCARLLSDKLTNKTDIKNLKAVKDLNLAEYDKVIIGGSILMGSIQKEVSDFCLENLNILRDKKVGLFICCMQDKDVANKQLNDAFPQEIMTNAVVKECFGGELVFKKMSFLHKLIVKKVSKIDKDTYNISEENINSFAQLMNNA